MATGWGEIDALEAVNQAIVFCGGSSTIFTDGFEDGTTGAWSVTTP